MGLRYLFDEHLRGELWDAVQFHNRGAINPLDVVRIGDTVALPLGLADEDILQWAAVEGRVVVSRDKRTMIAQLATHLSAGRSSPGLFIIRRRASLADVLAFLICAAYTEDDDQWRDQAIFIP